MARWGSYDYGYGFERSPTVAEQRARAQKARTKLKSADPVLPITGAIAKSFWGKSWCKHLESYGDYATRLPRGRSYARHGSVIDLRIAKGKVEARVQGSSLYTVSVTVKQVPAPRWSSLVDACRGDVSSIGDLLAGALSASVLTAVCDRANGLFPAPKEIAFECSCPDHASMCKHVAATLYGVGARFDERPELLFLLRGADHRALVEEAALSAVAHATSAPVSATVLDLGGLGDIFGIALDGYEPSLPEAAAAKKTATKKTATKKTATKKTATKKAAASASRSARAARATPSP